MAEWDGLGQMGGAKEGDEAGLTFLSFDFFLGRLFSFGEGRAPARRREGPSKTLAYAAAARCI